jgi:protein N-terminal amidase
MRVACLQFSPVLGDVKGNINRANAVLETHRPERLSLLVLPELAFTGYNFPSLEAIKPYLEPTSTGPSAQWAIDTALRLSCHVIVGYPEVATSTTPSEPTRYYNSTVTVSPSGRVIVNYRKSFLYYTDETWASEGPAGSAFYTHTATCKPFYCAPLSNLGTVGLGICMDINPYKFTAPWTDYEFASTMLRENVRLVVLSMAWLTRLLPAELEERPNEADMETVAYWIERFFPFIEQAPKDEIIVVFANRCGMEGNQTGVTHVENGQPVEEGDRVCYAGSSCVMRFKNGGVSMYDKGDGVAMLGKMEEGLLVVDTSQVSLDRRRRKGCVPELTLRQHAKWELRTVPRYLPGPPVA